MPKPGRRGNTRHILIITVSITAAAVLTVMALFAKSSQGYAVLLGYAILIMSAVLANHMIATSASDMRRMALLVLSVGILILFLGSLALIPFAPETTEETAPSPAVEAADENLTMGGHDRAFITLSSSDTAASVHGEEEGTAEPITSARTSHAVIWGIALPLLIAAIAGTAAAAFDLSDIVRYLMLAFTTGLLLFMLGGIVYILFTPERRIVAAAVEIPIAGESSEEEMIISEEPADEDVPPQIMEEAQPAVPSAPHVFPLITGVSVEAAPSSAVSPAITEETEETVQIPSSAAEEDAIPIIPSAPAMFSLITAIDEGEPHAVPVFIAGMGETEEEEASAPSIVPVHTEDEAAPVIIPVPTEDRTASETVEEPGVPRDMTAQQHAEDFWASFFIAGEDELQLVDGEYYMTLFINGNEVGDITVYIMGGVVYLPTGDVLSYVGDTITDEAESRIFGARGDLMSIDEFNEAGVAASLDSISYIVSMDFSTDDMPVQIISIRGSSNRFGYRPPIAGALQLEPAVFTLASRYSLSGSFTLNPPDRFLDTLRFNFSSYNTGRLYDVYFDFSYSMSFAPQYFNFYWGSYDFHYDFEDAMIRLSWGNVSPSLLSPSGTDLGIRFEKNSAYGPVGSSRRSHIERVITIEKESNVQIFNEGREIFNRTLQPGNYRLQDFVLYTGANYIKIIVTPLDGSPSYEAEIQLSYTSSLLAPGEVYYGGAIATGRNIVLSDSEQLPGTVRLSLGNGRSLEYDWRNIVVSGNIRAGLTPSLTMNAALAFGNEAGEESAFRPSGSLALEFTHANVLGTTRYNFNVDADTDDYGKFLLPGLYARIGHQVFTGFMPISSLNFGFTYDTDSGEAYDNHRFMLSTNLSGSYGIMSWGLSLSGTLNTDSIADIGWNASASMSFSFSRNFYLSASASVGGIGSEMQYLTGRVGATFRFSPATVNITASTYETSANVRVSSGGHSFSAEIAADDLAVLDSYTLDADYSYSGNYVNVSAGLSADNVFDSITGNFSLSTSSVFADGYLAFSSGVPSNYLFIKQKGALRGNILSVGTAGTSATEALPTIFDIGFYRSLPSSGATSLSVFSMAEGAFGNANSFDIYIPLSKRTGYVLKLEADLVYSASGVVTLPDGMLWANGSSPVYIMERNGADATLSPSDYYIFTDNDGRFIMSDLHPGTYAFDVMYEGEWYLYSFTVVRAEEHAADIQILGISGPDEALVVSDPYKAAFTFSDEISFLSGDDFWAMLYPMMEEAV